MQNFLALKVVNIYVLTWKNPLVTYRNVITLRNSASVYWIYCGKSELSHRYEFCRFFEQSNALEHGRYYVRKERISSKPLSCVTTDNVVNDR